MQERVGLLPPEATAASTHRWTGGRGRGTFSPMGGRHSTKKPPIDVARGAIKGGDLEAVSEGSILQVKSCHVRVSLKPLSDELSRGRQPESLLWWGGGHPGPAGHQMMLPNLTLVPEMPFFFFKYIQGK